MLEFMQNRRAVIMELAAAGLIFNSDAIARSKSHAKTSSISVSASTSEKLPKERLPTCLRYAKGKLVPAKGYMFYRNEKHIAVAKYPDLHTMV